MKLRLCVECGRSVLELRGQFALLNSFYVDEGFPDPTSAGTWHLSCLQASAVGPQWFTARHRNFVQIRKYESVLETDDWTVVRNPRTRETVSLGKRGELLSLNFQPTKARRIDGGGVYRVVEEYNLELDDPPAIKAIQDALVSVGTFPVLALIEVLGTTDRVIHAESLEESFYRYDRTLRGEWQADFVSMRADYGVFVPTELEPFVTRQKA